ncbi:MAG: two-component system, sensor histidine kinase [Sphingomonadales bacterium]|nr:two-component system, sensor histidine kinase [Sphingomonadales bacterium]
MATASPPLIVADGAAARARRRFVPKLFRPPPRFAPDLEAAFEADAAARSAGARRAALVLVLLVWVAYFGWDVFHSYRNKEMRQFLAEIFALRAVGAAWIGLSFLALARRELSARITDFVIAACLSVLYVLALLMVADTPFPYNYQFYFICLPLIMMFMFGLFGTRSRTLYALAAFAIAASFAVLPFAQTLEWNPGAGKTFDYFLFRSWNYYFLASILYLVSFAAIACAVAVERERAAREVFAREHELEALNQALRDSERDTQAKTAALVKVKDELRALAEQQNVAKSKFLADAAHDLRQPMQALTTLLAAARHALERGDRAKSTELLALADDASRLTRTSFNAVLEVSRLESGFVAADYSVFDLGALVHEAVAPCLTFATERGIEVRLRMPRSRVLVRSDPHLLSRIVGNLVSNAIKYDDPAKERRAVVIGIVALGSRARIDVVDNGVGIAEADWPKVFQPFVQLGNPERDREKGVGLGLSIVNAIMPLLSEHRLDMRSRQGKGTRFSLEVPLAGEDAAAADATPAATGDAAPDVAGIYVLYVEDDPLVRRATAALFESREILYEAYASFAELAAALPSLERTPDLVITDYRLPDGRTARDVARATARAFDSTLPLLVVTGEMGAIGGGKWLGSGRVLRKPVAAEMLVAQISALAPPPEQGAVRAAE